jgi:uncharacterized membrane protein
MAHAENEIIINKPVADVYAFVADGLNNPSWRPGVMNIELASGQIGQVGTQYKQIMKGPAGRNIEGDYKITAAVPNKELSFAVTAGPARPTGSYVFEVMPTGTKVTFILDFQPKGLAKLMGSMIQKTMIGEVAQLTNLKQLLESK